VRYQIVPVTPLQQNCSILWDPDTKRAVVVDPGGEIDRIDAALKRLNVTLERILLTHGHIDHVAGAPALRERTGVPIEGPRIDDAFWIRTLPSQADVFGFPPTPAFEPDRWLEDGDTVTVGPLDMAVIHCPGHTPGHVVFHHAPSKLLVVGDVLFHGSIGRTDFPKGNHEDLMRSINERLLPLGDDTAFIPGHGPMSTLGNERRSNPFLNPAAMFDY